MPNKYKNLALDILEKYQQRQEQTPANPELYQKVAGILENQKLPVLERPKQAPIQQVKAPRDFTGRTAADYNMMPSMEERAKQLNTQYTENPLAGFQQEQYREGPAPKIAYDDFKSNYSRYKGQKTTVDSLFGKDYLDTAKTRLASYSSKESLNPQEQKDFNNIAYSAVQDIAKRAEQGAMTDADIEVMNTLNNIRVKNGAAGEAFGRGFQNTFFRLPQTLSDFVNRDNQNYKEAQEARNQYAEQLTKEHPLANIGGNLAGGIATYAIGNAALEGLGAIPALSNTLQGAGMGAKSADVAARLLGGEALDIALDTVPTEIQNYQQGMRGWDLAADTTKNLAINAGFNIAGELPGLIKSARAAGNADIPSISKAANTGTDYFSIRERIGDKYNPMVPEFQKISKQQVGGTLDKYGTLSELVNSGAVDTSFDGVVKNADIINAEKQSVDKQITNYVQGRMGRDEVFDYGVTPEIAKKYGITGDRLFMTQSSFDKVSLPEKFGGGYHGHAFGKDGAIQIIDGLNDPVAIMKSKNNSIVEFTELVNEAGDPVIIPLRVAKNGGVDVGTEISSAYDKQGIADFIKKNRDRFVYVDKTRALSSAADNGLEVPVPTTRQALSSASNIAEAAPTVKPTVPGIEHAVEAPARTELPRVEAPKAPAMEQFETVDADFWRGYYARSSEAAAGGEGASEVMKRMDVAEKFERAIRGNGENVVDAYRAAVEANPTEKTGLRKLFNAWKETQPNGAQIEADLASADYRAVQARYKELKQGLTDRLSEAGYKKGSTIYLTPDEVDHFKLGRQSRVKAVDGLNKTLYSTGVEARMVKPDELVQLTGGNIPDRAATVSLLDDSIAARKEIKKVGKQVATDRNYATSLEKEARMAAREVPTLEPQKSTMEMLADENPEIRQAIDGIVGEKPRTMAAERPRQPQVTTTPEALRARMAGNTDEEAAWDALMRTAAGEQADEAAQETAETAGQRMAREAMEGNLEYKPGGTYQSQTYTNSLRNSGVFEDSVLDDIADSVSFQTVSEKEHVATAVKQLKADWDGTVARYTADFTGKPAKQVKDAYDATDVDGMFITAQRLRQMASETTDPALKAQYTAQARRIALNITQTGHDTGSKLQAFAKWTRTADGAVTAAEGITESQVADALKRNKGLAEGIEDVAGAIDKRLQDIRSSQLWDDLVNGALDAEARAGDKDALREQIEAIIREAVDGNAAVAKSVDDEGIARIADSLMNERELADLEKNLEFIATGYDGVKQDTIDRVYGLFDEAQKLPFDSRERVRLEREAYAALAADLGVGKSFGDKVNTWRYLAMLGNPRTHIRNIAGNIGFKGVTDISDNVSAIAQNIGEKLTGGRYQAERSVVSALSPTDRRNMQKASGLVDDYLFRRLSDGNKWYGTANEIMRSGKAFPDNNPLFKAVNWLSDKNSGALDIEDYFALKRKFGRSMAQRMKAAGVDADELETIVKHLGDEEALKGLADPKRVQLVQRMIDGAVEDAKYATFHTDKGWGASLARTISRASQNTDELAKNADSAMTRAAGRLGHTVIEATVPFKKTPANILKSGVDFSPLGLISGAMDLHSAVKTGQISASEAIDELSRGLTGTGMMALGAYLYHEGLIDSSGTGDDRVDYYNQMQGKQKYALNLPGKDGEMTSFTIDWAAPEVLPVLVGAEIWKQVYEDTDKSPADFIDGLATIGTPLVESTMLQGIANGLTSLSGSSNYDKGSKVTNFLANSVAGYASQLVPTIGGSVARTIDPVRRSTYSDQEGIAKTVDQQIKKAKNKIPGLSSTNNASIDMWGRENQNSGGNMAGRAIQNFISPGYINKENVTDVDRELNALIKESGESKVAPTYAASSIDGRKLSPDEYERHARVSGSIKYEMLDSLTKSDAYGRMDTADKVDAVKDAYTIANAISAKELFGDTYNVSKENQKYYDAYQDGGVQGLLARVNMENEIHGTGLNVTEKAINAYKEGGLPAVEKMAEYKAALSAAGVSDSEKMQAIYDKRGQQGIELYARVKKQTNADGKGSISIDDFLTYLNKNPKTPGWIVEEMGPGSGTYKQKDGKWVYQDAKGKVRGDTAELPTLNVGSAAQYERYQSIPGVDTSAKSFERTWNKMDSDGNGALKKAEVVAYLDNSGYDTDTKRALFNAYKTNGNWKNPY